MAYDLAQARQHEAEIKVKRVVRRKLVEPRVLKYAGRGSAVLRIESPI